MKRAIVTHLRDFVAIAVIVAIAVGIGGYILVHQGVRFPLIEESTYKIWVEVENARGVTPGQGQTVRVAGMRVGDVGKVKLEDGKALVRMDLDPEHDRLVRRDATVLLRPRTGLKDMFLALDPGSRDRPAVKEGGVIDSSNTLPDVNADEVLEALDTDTRAYLGLLINGAGLGLKERDYDLRQVFARLGPLHRDLRTLNTEVVKRKRNLARLINNYGSTVERLGKEDRDLTRLVLSADRVFDRLAVEDERISLAVSRLPTTLRQAESTLLKVGEFAETARPAFAGAAPRGPGDRRGQLGAASPRADRRADAAREDPPVRATGPALRARAAPGRARPRHGQPQSPQVLLRAQPLLQPRRPSTQGAPRGSPATRRPTSPATRACCSGSPGSRTTPTRSSRRVTPRARSGASSCSPPAPRIQQTVLDFGPTAPIVEDVLGVKDLLSDTKICTPS